jgi:hypothetical protein
MPDDVPTGFSLTSTWQMDRFIDAVIEDLEVNHPDDHEGEVVTNIVQRILGREPIGVPSKLTWSRS